MISVVPKQDGSIHIKYILDFEYRSIDRSIKYLDVRVGSISVGTTEK